MLRLYGQKPRIYLSKQDDPATKDQGVNICGEGDKINLKNGAEFILSAAEDVVSLHGDNPRLFITGQPATSNNVNELGMNLRGDSGMFTFANGPSPVFSVEPPVDETSLVDLLPVTIWEGGPAGYGSYTLTTIGSISNHYYDAALSMLNPEDLSIMVSPLLTDTSLSYIKSDSHYLVPAPGFFNPAFGLLYTQAIKGTGPNGAIIKVLEKRSIFKYDSAAATWSGDFEYILDITDSSGVDIKTAHTAMMSAADPQAAYDAEGGVGSLEVGTFEALLYFQEVQSVFSGDDGQLIQGKLNLFKVIGANSGGVSFAKLAADGTETVLDPNVLFTAADLADVSKVKLKISDMPFQSSPWADQSALAAAAFTAD